MNAVTQIDCNICKLKFCLVFEKRILKFCSVYEKYEDDPMQYNKCSYQSHCLIFRLPICIVAKHLLCIYPINCQFKGTHYCYLFYCIITRCSVIDHVSTCSTVLGFMSSKCAVGSSVYMYLVILRNRSIYFQ